MIVKTLVGAETLGALGAETFASITFREFHEFCQNSKNYILTDWRKFMHAKFFKLLFFSPNLAVITPDLDNGLLLASWRKKGPM